MVDGWWVKIYVNRIKYDGNRMELNNYKKLN